METSVRVLFQSILDFGIVRSVNAVSVPVAVGRHMFLASRPVAKGNPAGL